ncbi:2'-5' RNA ligase family protein [Hydrogenophaga sp.]|uniref:2'-5' RNA ligase family protein n=1 Tax=Hydrogenophaga sp. TaxID=1904254 RepID=UPI00262E2654|nr:2'-5' RNA ligase family protein [Hydrogenophaga sp.]MDM7950859.1 2'-5' RNA ligase family protein [Hydrogenophaga sp.]
MAITAFVVRVPSAEVIVTELRTRYDATFQQGVPAHITVLVPFMDPGQVTPAVLAQAREALMEVPSFEFSLRRVGRFPATAYLAPEPPSAFVALTSALVRAFPEFPPYGGEHASVIPHLTVAHGEAQSAALGALELEKKMRTTGPIAARCTSVVLIENSTGQWKELHVFDLPLSAKM